jgi:hypothetical protein
MRGTSRNLFAWHTYTYNKKVDGQASTHRSSCLGLPCPACVNVFPTECSEWFSECAGILICYRANKRFWTVQRMYLQNVRALTIASMLFTNFILIFCLNISRTSPRIIPCSHTPPKFYFFMPASVDEISKLIDESNGTYCDPLILILLSS